MYPMANRLAIDHLIWFEQKLMKYKEFLILNVSYFMLFYFFLDADADGTDVLRVRVSWGTQHTSGYS